MIVKDFGQSEAWRTWWQAERAKRQPPAFYRKVQLAFPHHNRWHWVQTTAPPFKAGPIPASEYRDGCWRDAALTVWHKPTLIPVEHYPYRRQRVP